MTDENSVPLRRSGLADQLVEHLLADIAGGTYPPGSRMPPEPELAQRNGVSRLTLREAIKDLRQRGVVRVEQGRGTFVNPPEEWSPFDSAVLNARVTAETSYELAHELTELRVTFETGIAELAALRRSDEDLDRMSDAIERMKNAWNADDMDAYAAADVDFHDAVLRAAGNTFALSLFRSIDGALREVRRRTSTRNPDLAGKAVEQHTRIMQAIRRSAPKVAASRMAEHLHQTEIFTAELVAQARANPRILHTRKPAPGPDTSPRLAT